MPLSSRRRLVLHFSARSRPDYCQPRDNKSSNPSIQCDFVDTYASDKTGALVALLDYVVVVVVA